MSSSFPKAWRASEVGCLGWGSEGHQAHCATDKTEKPEQKINPETTMIKNISQRYAILVAIGFLALSGGQAVAVQIYSSGDFKDPSSNPLAPTDRSHAWYGGTDLGGANVLAQSFTLSSTATLDSVRLWTYDTIDGSSGLLEQVWYAIYSGAQPTGTPDATGMGIITSSADLAGHSSSGLKVIETSFDLVAQYSLMAGTTYWLCLSAVTSPFGVSNSAQWADANVAGGSYLVRNGQGWDNVNGTRAFELNGKAGSLAVPDGGSTFLLLGTALAGLVGLRGVSSRQWLKI